MSEEAIKAVLQAHTDRLMALPGVVGTGLGQSQGQRCIKVFVAAKTADLRAKIPAALEGYQVVIKETGAVQSATMRLFVENPSSNGPSIYGTDNSWTEMGITWDNRPAPTTGAIANLGAAANGTWAEFDVTAYITGDGTYSFVLLPDSSDGIKFSSREGGSPPELVNSFGSRPAPTNIPTVALLNE